MNNNKLGSEHEEPNGFVLHVRFRAPNRLFYRCNAFPMGKWRTKTPTPERKRDSECDRRAADPLGRVTASVCVCFCVSPLWYAMGTLQVRRPLLGNDDKIRKRQETHFPNGDHKNFCGCKFARKIRKMSPGEGSARKIPKTPMGSRLSNTCHGAWNVPLANEMYDTSA